MVIDGESGVPIFRILGPLQVALPGSAEYDVPPGRQQIVLAALLLAANRVVSIGHLVDAIWENDPPVTARTLSTLCVALLGAAPIAAQQIAVSSGLTIERDTVRVGDPFRVFVSIRVPRTRRRWAPAANWRARRRRSRVPSRSGGGRY